ncbi:hypothetical protein ROS9278_03699 [Roseomonas sp. CECT 9278]|nr:hypothetical protein ROS9278_03699 [Roseomonas sp. CECT 9278]
MVAPGVRRSSAGRIASVLGAALWCIGLCQPAGAQALRRDAPASPARWRCGEKTYCTQMTSCDEALFHFRHCGLLRLDGDRDGVPCERLCGRPASTRRR